jgi:hypothetical protein
MITTSWKSAARLVCFDTTDADAKPAPPPA